MRRLRLVLPLLALTAGCESLLGADFGRPLGDENATKNGEGGADGDGDGDPGGPSSDGDGGGNNDGTTSDGMAPTGGRTPLDIFGTALRVWLDASKEAYTSGGETLVAWNDQSGNGTNAHLAGSGGGAVYLRANQVNGLPAMVFDSDAIILGNNAPDIGTNDDFYIAVVAAYSTLGPNDRFFFSRWSSFSRGYGLYAGQQNTPAVGGALDETATIVSSTAGNTADNVFRVYALRRTAGSKGNAKLDVRVNGASTSAEVPYATVPTDRPLAFGGAQEPNGAFARFLVGSMAEIVVVKGAVPDTDAVEVETSLAAKYGL